MSAAESIRILLVDDHYVVRMGLKAILATDKRLKVIAEANDGAQAVALYRQLRPSLVLMDLRMPGVDGVEATRQICAEFSAACVVILSTLDGDEDIHRALEAGARSYLLKDIPGPEFLAALHRVYGGQHYLPPNVARRLEERTPCAELTTKELEVLQLLGKGFSNREMGELLHVSENTIKSHLKTVFAKLEVNDRAEAVASALQRGILRLG